MQFMVLLVTGMLTAGCASSPPAGSSAASTSTSSTSTAATATSKVSNPLTIEAAQYDAIYEASIDVLRDAGFRVAQRDYRFGEVATQAKGSPILIEVWRGDNTTLRQGVLSTLSDVRRLVRVQLQPAENATDAEAGRSPAAAETPEAPEAPGLTDASDADDTAHAAGRYEMHVTVVMERLQVPVRRLTGSVRTGVFSRLERVPIEWRRQGIAASYWQPIGRDAHLEQRLLQQIVRRADTLSQTEGAGEIE